jgi:hypothetical protein
VSDPAYTCHFLDAVAFAAAESARMDLARSRKADQQWLRDNHADYGWARLDEVVKPCAMWFVPWYFDECRRRAEQSSGVAAGPQR